MNACVLALVMLLDVSHSVDNGRWIQQRDGHADAFRSSAVLEFIETTGPIAVSVAGFGSRAEVIQDWMILTNRLEALHFADRFSSFARPSLEMLTFTGAGMQISLDLHQNVPCNPERRVIDVVADGAENGGPSPSIFRDIATEQGITINTIAVLNSEQAQDIQEYFIKFMNEQVRTPDGFSMTSNGFDDIFRTIRRKIELEIIGDSNAPTNGIL